VYVNRICKTLRRHGRFREQDHKCWTASCRDLEKAVIVVGLQVRSAPVTATILVGITLQGSKLDYILLCRTTMRLKDQSSRSIVAFSIQFV
jgi:hypothetical protein